MEESEKKEILHQVKREIYHIKKVTVHTAQQDGEISDPDIAIADTTVKRSQQAAYHLAARTGKLIFQRRQKDTAVRSLQRTKASEKQQTASSKARQQSSAKTSQMAASQQTHTGTTSTKSNSGSTSSYHSGTSSSSSTTSSGSSAKTKSTSLKSSDSGIKMQKKDDIRFASYFKEKASEAQKNAADSGKESQKREYAVEKAAKEVAKAKLIKLAAKKIAADIVQHGIFGILGTFAIVVLMAVTLLMCISGSQASEEERKRQNASTGAAAVSDTVLQYSDLITQYANDNGIGRYVALIEAIMMQESGGVGTNVMQVNFGPVTTVEDSIRMGVGYVRTCLEMARVTDPNDMDHIKVALQGYNYGTGYVTWVWSNYDGVYSEENAKEYSEMQKARNGWSIYGDPQYVPHVLQYYSVSSGDVEFITDGAAFAWPVPGHTNITSTYGYRWGTLHKGIDISDGGIEGQPVVASRSGTVTRADNACPHNYPKNSSCGCGGGYGNRVEISHGDGTSTLYGHMLTITVSVGQTVNQGDIIGYVGCTGYSTGTHLHFEIKQNGTQVDPMPYL